MGVQSWDRGAAAGANEGEEVCVTAYYIKIGMMQKRRKSDDGGEGALLEPRSSGGGGRASLARSTEVPGGKARGLSAGQGADVAAEPWKEVVSGCSFAQGSRRRE